MSWIYVIAPVATSVVKIGHANDVDARLRELQVGHHRELTVVVQKRCFDAPATERAFHRALHNDRVRGEWFHRTVDVERLIHALKAARTYRQIESCVPRFIGRQKCETCSSWLDLNDGFSRQCKGCLAVERVIRQLAAKLIHRGIRPDPVLRQTGLRRRHWFSSHQQETRQ